MSKLSRKRIAVSLAGFLFALCVAEAALRVFHAVNPPPTLDNFDLAHDENTDLIRILTVGESTTAANGFGPPPTLLASTSGKHAEPPFHKYRRKRKSRGFQYGPPRIEHPVHHR